MSHEYEDWARANLNVISQNGNELMCRCEYHENEGSASMQVNIDKGLFVCFSCDAKGTFGHLAKHLGLRWSTNPTSQINELIAKLNTLQGRDRKPQLTVLPEDHLDRYDFPNTYWSSRGFRPETIAAFDLGFDPMRNIATIPLRRTDGGLTGVIRRYLDDDVEFKYRYPKFFHRNENMFGSWLASEDPSHMAVLVEGAVDAMKVWQAGYIGLAAYGSSISPMQVRLMHRLGIRELTLFPDNDKAGRKMLRTAQGVKLHRRGDRLVEDYDPLTDLRRDFLVREATYRRASGTDPGSLSSKEIRFAVEHGVRLL